MKTINIVLLVVIGVLTYFLFYSRSTINHQREEIETLKLKTDTVYRDRLIKVLKPFETILPPKLIVMYQDTGSTRFDLIKLHGNNLVLFDTKLNDSLIISKRFLTHYPLSEKLIGFELDRNSLNLQLFSISGFAKEKKYDLDLDRFKYRYTNNELSRKKRFNLTLIPEVEYSYRMLNKLHDLNVSLNLKTSGFNYVIGLNGFYYPTFEKTGYDVNFTVRYNFR